MLGRISPLYCTLTLIAMQGHDEPDYTSILLLYIESINRIGWASALLYYDIIISHQAYCGFTRQRDKVLLSDNYQVNLTTALDAKEER